MQIVAIANQKGGVGKSTLAVHLAWLALEQARPVLLVDLDGQANSSRTFVDEFTGLLASSLFTEEPGCLTGSPQAISEQLSLIPADMAINDVEGLELDSIERPAAHLRALPLAPETLVIIDTPPTLGRRLLSALIAADAVVSPVALNGYSIQGITDLQKTIQTVIRRFNPRLKNIGLLANMVNSRSATHTRMLAELRQALGDKLLPVTLGHRVAISDAIDNGRPVWQHSRGESAQRAAQEMRGVCTAILEKLP
ncbi:MAG: ParA family protein [Lamprobacter sp.]|uniref:ParA family protein n=1 Tax=Lamprobacter sp. TaxID=3100796 RepID=UPI002B263FB4|nr:ParA family protein [Lamprobacter sp.]MEA3643020.1 ParA family protein [Lamprobacter sp.]